MAQNKMLRLKEILEQESDVEHPITTNELLEKLAKSGISCDRRTLARNIKQLQHTGCHVLSVKIKHSNAFYLEQHNFSIAELKILIDAVQASSAIPEKLTDVLIEKLANLGGTHCAELLKHNRVRFNIRKQSNNSILDTIAMIEESIMRQTQISFLYFKHDENGYKVYQRNKQRYVVDPIAFIYINDNYYLRCYNADRQGYRNYRIDRMEDVLHLTSLISREALISAKELETYTTKTFKMYSGKEAEVVLEFTDSLIDVVFDQFGMDVKIKRLNNNLLTTKVRVEIAQTFWGWYFQFPDQMKIISPKWVVEKCQEVAKNALKTDWNE